MKKIAEGKFQVFRKGSALPWIIGIGIVFLIAAAGNADATMATIL